MSTLPRADRRPEYKDYVNFLGSYKSGKKDDQISVTTDSGVGFSLTNSSNNSSSSLHSDMSEHSTKGSYRNYLQTLNNKKYHPVKPNFNKNDKPKTVKTEMFINITNEEEAVVTKTFEVSRQSNVSVSEVSKKFEQKPTLKKQNSIGRISQKFESNNSQETPHISTPIQVKKAESIKKVSKIFQEETNPEPEHSQGVKILEKRVDLPLPPQLPKNGFKPPQTKIEVLPAVSNNIPPPPKLPQNGFKPPITSPKPTIVKQFNLESSESQKSVPPAPPLPPPSFNMKQPQVKVPKVTSDVQNNKTSDGVDGKRTTIDRNDPRVKKMVYGALREMYGAYHDKANDYLATLPKNMVRKNNGLDQIINSIASQGGLDKLTGRTNPNSEMNEN